MTKRNTHIERMRLAFIAMLLSLAWPSAVFAQDLEPRRWAHFPVGMNIAGVTYVYTDGDLSFDPVLELDDVEMDAHTTVFAYARSLNVFGKTGRIDLILPYKDTSWEGLLSGNPASTSRDGFADPWIRFSVNLLGAPALKGKEYLDYRAAHTTNTVLGAAIGVMLPLGEYKEDKLLNLGQNRFIIRPQTGIVHTRGPWSYEVTGSVFFFTENDDFFGGNERKQDPLFAYQTHVIHTFQNKWWASLGAGYSFGGESEVDGNSSGDKKGNLLSAVSFGLPVGKYQALRFIYLRGDTQVDTGIDSNSFAVSWNVRF